MRVKIYQINPDRDTNRIKFFGMDALPKLQGSKDVDASRYDEVFNAELEEDNPEAIYSQFNAEGHPLHRGHSLSVSDVVVNDHGAFFATTLVFGPSSLMNHGRTSRITSCGLFMWSRISLRMLRRLNTR